MASNTYEIKNLRTANELTAFLDNDNRSLHHTEYYHYTRIDSARSIIDSQSLWFHWLGRDQQSNDPIEREAYRDNKNVFSLCFSVGTSENLPLWYLYSGLTGNGVRFGFTKSMISKILDIDTAELVILKKENGNNSEVSRTTIAKANGDFEICARDILYIGKDSVKNAYRARYGIASIFDIPPSEINTLKEKYRLHLKGLIWSYEKETRLSIRVKDSLLQELPDDEYYIVAVKIDKLLQRVKLRTAPETSPDDFLTKGAAMALLKNRVKPSDYIHQIEMKLLEKEQFCSQCKEKGKETAT